MDPRHDISFKRGLYGRAERKKLLFERTSVIRNEWLASMK